MKETQRELTYKLVLHFFVYLAYVTFRFFFVFFFVVFFVLFSFLVVSVAGCDLPLRHTMNFSYRILHLNKQSSK